MTMSRRARARLAGSVAAAALVTTGAITGALPAEAKTTRGCAANANSCIRASANGTYVDYVEARNGRWQHPKFLGHFQVTGPGFSFDSPEITIGKYATSYRFPLNRSLPDQSQVCSTTWKHTGGKVVFDGRSCLTIHR